MVGASRASHADVRPRAHTRARCTCRAGVAHCAGRCGRRAPSWSCLRGAWPAVGSRSDPPPAHCISQARTSDSARIDAVRAQLCRAGHPNGKFGWGNAKSLEEDPVELGINVRAPASPCGPLLRIVALCACVCVLRVGCGHAMAARRSTVAQPLTPVRLMPARVLVACSSAGSRGVAGVPQAVLQLQHHGGDGARP